MAMSTSRHAPAAACCCKYAGMKQRTQWYCGLLLVTLLTAWQRTHGIKDLYFARLSKQEASCQCTFCGQAMAVQCLGRGRHWDKTSRTVI